MGACGDEKRFPNLYEKDDKNDGTPIIAFLTLRIDDYDLLMKMLKDILKIQNKFLEDVQEKYQKIENFRLFCCEEFQKIKSFQVPPNFYDRSGIPTNSSILLCGDLEGVFESFLLSQGNIQ